MSAPKPATPSSTQKPATPTIPSSTAAKPTVPLKPGSAYPAQHTSTIDVSVNPIHPATSKPILATDLDADFPSEEDKPWRRPGSDISDYFNYGFDEFTWASYCLKQQDLRKEVNDQKKQMDEMQAFLGMPGGMPGIPGAPSQQGPGGISAGAGAGGGGPGQGPGPVPVSGGSGGGGGGRGTPGPPPPGPGPGPGPGPPQGAGPQNPMQGMPPGMSDLSPDMMQGMLTGMMAQGLDPSAMDPMTFMHHVQAMMGGGQPGAGAPQGGQQGYGGQPQPGQGFGGQGGGQDQMGYGGYDQHGAYGGGGRGKGIRRW